MKITVNVDCTPEEMRRLVGLPDVKPFNDDLMEEMKKKMLAGVEGYDALSLFTPYMNNAMAGMEMFNKLMGMAMTTGGGKDSSKSG